MRELVRAGFSGPVRLDLEVQPPYEWRCHMGVQAAAAGWRRMRSGAWHGAWQALVAGTRMSTHVLSGARLTSRPGWLSSEQVTGIQRARILAAAVDSVQESGYAAMTIADVVQRARISRKTFYDVFANRGECFAAVVEEISARASSLATSAYTAENGWLAATRAALNSLLCLIDEEPGLARIWFVDAMSGPKAVHEHKAEVMAMLAATVDLGRGLVSEKRQPSQLTAEATVGGISQIISTRLLNGSRASFVDLLGPCMYLIALPYLGVERATAELRREPSVQKPRRQVPDTCRRSQVLRDMNIRVTYRTIRTLDAICEQPGANNRTVAEKCGINDPGQVSKLLSRLERLALIENRGLGHDHGASNAWYIAPRGLELMRATNVYQFMRSRGAP
jgi:AcrR family transcriptional regulator